MSARDAHAAVARFERVALGCAAGRLAVGDHERDVGCRRRRRRRRAARSPWPPAPAAANVSATAAASLARRDEPRLGGEPERRAVAVQLERRGGGDDAGHGVSVLFGCGARGRRDAPRRRPSRAGRWCGGAGRCVDACVLGWAILRKAGVLTNRSGVHTAMRSRRVAAGTRCRYVGVGHPLLSFERRDWR